MREAHLFLPAEPGVIREGNGKGFITLAELMNYLVHSALFDGGTAQLRTLGIFDPPHDK